MINLSNLFGGDAKADQPTDAGATPAGSLPDLFAGAEETGEEPNDGATQAAEPDEGGLLQADDEIGSIVASMTDLSSDLDFIA